MPLITRKLQNYLQRWKYQEDFSKSKPNAEDEEERLFDELLDQAMGGSSFYINYFNIVYNVVLVFIITLAYSNSLIVLSVPKHWCHVDGQSHTNLSSEQWKHLTLPIETRADSQLDFSECSQYNVSLEVLERYNYSKEAVIEHSKIVECQNGYEYDRTWFQATIPSTENWVCEQEILISNSISFGRIGDVLGTFIFGVLSDTAGRKPVFYITLCLLMLGRFTMIYGTNIFYLFCLGQILSNFPSTAVYQTPYIIALEICKSDERSKIILYEAISFVIANSAIPWLLWIVGGDWYPFMLLTTIPSLFYFATYWDMIESPRWLFSSNKIEKATATLNKIAQKSNTRMPSDTFERLQKEADSKAETNVFGPLGLIANRRLTINTCLLFFVTSVISLIYSTVLYNINYLDGDPYANYFWQSLIELPGYIIAQYLCDIYGRRFTSLVSMSLASFSCLNLIFLVTSTDMGLAVRGFLVMIRFCICIAGYCMNLQTLEIYPTCLRQTGSSLLILANGAIAVLSPYIVWFGVNYNASIPYALQFALALAATVAGTYLPETANTLLPETIADTEHFGEDQRYFSFIVRKNNDQYAKASQSQT